MASSTPTALRILRFPLVRILLLGPSLFLLMGISNGLWKHFLPDSPLAALGSAAAMASVALAVYAGFVRFVEGRPVRELSLPGAGFEFTTGLLIGAGLYAACVGVLMLMGIYQVDGLNAPAVLLPALAMALSSGILEELIYRGVVFRILEESLGSWIALILASLFFGLRHLSNPDGTLQGALFIAVEAGVLLGAAFMLTRRLWLAMGFHMAWNYVQAAVFSGAVSGTGPQRGLLQARIEGPELLTGGSFGLEASLVAFLLCTTAGVILLFKAVRRGHLLPAPWNRGR
jgi:membrane protease YdiL (CAAX protease family)